MYKRKKKSSYTRIKMYKNVSKCIKMYKRKTKSSYTCIKMYKNV